MSDGAKLDRFDALLPLALRGDPEARRLAAFATTQRRPHRTDLEDALRRAQPPLSQRGAFDASDFTEKGPQP